MGKLIRGGQMEKFAQPGDFCPNEACPDHGKLQTAQPQNLEKFGKTRTGVQRYRCQACRKTLTATFGTIFYGKPTPEHELLETLALLAQGHRISALSRVKGPKEDTIWQWLRQAARQAEQLEGVLMPKFKVKRAQLEALWDYVRNKGEKSYPETDESGQFWRSPPLDSDSRLRVARGMGQDETQASNVANCF